MTFMREEIFLCCVNGFLVRRIKGIEFEHLILYNIFLKMVGVCTLQLCLIRQMMLVPLMDCVHTAPA